MRLFEAARWAPSSFNTQQWRALFARRGTQTLADLLRSAGRREQSLGKKRGQCQHFYFAKTFRSRQRTFCHAFWGHDSGAAWEKTTYSIFYNRCLVVHGMQGFDYERTRKGLPVVGRVPSRSDGRRSTFNHRNVYFLKNSAPRKSVRSAGDTPRASSRAHLSLNRFST